MRRNLALSSLLALSLVACGGPAGPDTIKIGFIGPLTGDTAAVGIDMLNGAKMAIEQANAAIGDTGPHFQLIAEDGKCSGADAASAAQKLTSVDKVTAIIGGLCSGETLAAASIADPAQVPLFSPWSSSPDVTMAGDFVFRNYPSDALKTVAMAAYFAEEGYEKVALISENTDFAQAFRTALIASLPDGAVVFDETVEPGTKDFRSLLGRLNSVDFDVFFPNPNGDAMMGLMVQQFREEGFAEPIVSHDVAESLAVPEIAGAAAEGMRLINVPTAGAGTPFEAAFVAAFGTPQSTIAWGAFAYDATQVVMHAITEAGTEGPAIRDYLYNFSAHDGVVGNISFDDNGDVIGVPYALKEFQSGVIVTIRSVSVE